MGKGRQYVVTAAAVAACLGGLSACQLPTPTATRDCAAELRFHGVSYFGVRFTRHPSTRVGKAFEECGNEVVTGAHPVVVWSVPGVSPAQLIARRIPHGRFAVYVATSLPPKERARLLRAISRDH